MVDFITRRAFTTAQLVLTNHFLGQISEQFRNALGCLQKAIFQIVCVAMV